MIHFKGFCVAILLVFCSSTVMAAQNSRKDFSAEYLGDEEVAFWIFGEPKNTDSFVLHRKISDKGQWEKIRSYPFECTLSPIRPCIDGIKPEDAKIGIYYKLNAVDKNGKNIKNYEQLYLPPYNDN